MGCAGYPQRTTCHWSSVFLLVKSTTAFIHYSVGAFRPLYTDCLFLQFWFILSCLIFAKKYLFFVVCVIFVGLVLGLFFCFVPFLLQTYLGFGIEISCPCIVACASSTLSPCSRPRYGVVD